MGAREVLDLAAGTGPLTAGLLELGLSVVAVEPLDEMRALIPDGARTLAGTAEQIPLPDASVDAVFVGQAWHWFDVPRAVTEAHRVLRPGGTLTPMWNLLDAADPLSRSLSDLAMHDECSARMLTDEAVAPYDATGLFGVPERIITRYDVPYDAGRVEALIASTSVSILASAEERAATFASVRDAMPAGEFTLSWICEAWTAEKLPAQ
jgi:SAM-dependent methyltransferase